MPFQKGQSGNPSGRPPKSRALTAILDKAGGTTLEVDGKRVAGRRLVARYLWEAATVGTVTMVDGKVLKLSPRDWLELVKWLYAQIDGPPKHEVDVTSAGEALNIQAWIKRAEQNTLEMEQAVDELE